MRSLGEGKGTLWVSLVIATAVWILCSIGLLILDSAGAAGSNPHSIALKQACFLCVAFIALLATMFVDLQKLRKFALPLAVASIILLIAVLFPQIGHEVNGSRRWIRLFGDFGVQVSDFAKITLILLLSSYLHDNQRQMQTFKNGILKPMGIVGIFCALIIAEPDFGTMALCGGVGMAMIFMAGCPKKILFSLATIAIVGVSILLYFNPNRRRRILSFMDVENTKLEGSYQLYQAILGFGVGGVDGAGIGQGRQQLSFLPEAHTDFVFAIVGEELGLIVTTLVVMLFAIIFFAGIWSLRKANNRFEMYMLTGAVFMITFQAVFNLCVVTGLMPTKGISLPFISYGGSNLVVMFVLLGIIFNCLGSWSKPTKIKAVEYE